MSGRIRSVKPEWLEDEILASTSDAARMLSVALILMADDHGRGRAAIATIAAEAWRYEMQADDGANARETLAKASRALRELVEARFVMLYEVDRQRYFEIRSWKKHQRVDKPSKPRVPAPIAEENQALTGDSRDPREELAEASRGSREMLAPDLRSPTSDHRGGGERDASDSPQDSRFPQSSPMPGSFDVAEALNAINRARQSRGVATLNPMAILHRDDKRAPYYALSDAFPVDTIAAIEREHGEWIDTATDGEKKAGHPVDWWLRAPTEGGIRAAKAKRRPRRPSWRDDDRPILADLSLKFDPEAVS